MKNSKLFFNDWAKNWEEALPLGNGSLGAMVYGNAHNECIQLNEDTLWSGKPLDESEYKIQDNVKIARELVEKGEYKEAEKYIESNMLGHWTQGYLPAGSISINFLHNDISKFSRELDLIDGIMNVNYINEGINYNREYLCSYVDDIMMVRISSDKPKSIHCNIKISSELKHNIDLADNCIRLKGEAPIHVDPSYDLSDNPIRYSEEEKGIEFCSMLKVETDGQVKLDNEAIDVQEGSYINIYISCKTNFINSFVSPDSSKKNPVDMCKKIIDNAAQKGYTQIRDRHIRDFSERMKRVCLTFNSQEDNINITTKDRILNMADKEQLDPILMKQVFDFGRYLILSCSREGSQASNLQGIWNNLLQAPWCSNYTININTEMNYWPVDVANLSECYEPLISLIKDLAKSGINTAKEFGCRGWTANHNTDLWRQTIPVNGQALFAFWPFGGPWLTTHLYEHYCYTKDIDYLKEIYPIIKGSVLFCLDWGYVDKENHFVTAPSTSPENRYKINDDTCSITKASAMDMSIMWQLFTDCIACIDKLKIEEDYKLKEELLEAKSKIYPYHINSKGQIGEWWDDRDDYEYGHRHVSHLWGLYPGHRVDCDKDEVLLKAHNKSLIDRVENGGGHTSWSCAWVMLLFARLRDKDKTKTMLMKYLKNSLIINGLSSHPPFQIDGNFGYTAAICEMLVQSHNEYIEILPALPQELHSGSFSGMKVRGGYEVSAKWENGIVNEVNIISNKEQEVYVKVNNKIRKMKTKQK